MEYNGTFKDRRPLDIDWLTETAKRHSYEYDETGFIAFGPSGKSVAVKFYALPQVASPEAWTWEIRECDKYPYEASVMRDGVQFYALFTDKEAAQFLEA